MYIKYKDFNGSLNEDELLLMSLEDFESGGKDLLNVAITVTPNGEEPPEVEFSEEEWN